VARFARQGGRLALPTLLFVLVLTLTTSDPRLPSAPAVAPIASSQLPDVTADVWKSRGHIVHLEPFNDPPFDAPDPGPGRGWRGVYTSVSGLDGGRREVSGAFFVPRGTPPEDGWPVISFAHGTTGIGNDCGPSRQPNLMGYLPIVKSLLQNKFAVAVTDFEGLGESGSHLYLEPRSAAFNTIDAVRALREISPTVSTRWVALGYSQGGQAVWAANELNPYYGSDLRLLGTVALAPAANLSGGADLIWSRSMTEDQREVFPLLILGLARYTRDLDATAFLHGSTETHRRQLSRCQITDGKGSGGAQPEIAPVPWQAVVDRLRESNDLRPANVDDIATLRDALRRVAVPQRPLDKPMLVITGTRDALILSKWVASAVAGSCALGGEIEFLQVPYADHRNILWNQSRTVHRWITSRFAGTPAPSNCPAQQR
jgi:dienelactone hydrolase